MNLTNTLLSARSRRVALFLMVALIAVGFLIYPESLAVKVLGALLTTLVGVVLKALSEVQGEVRRALAEVRRVDEAVMRSGKEREAAAREAEQRLDRVEASVSRVGRQAFRVQEDIGRQLAKLSEETRVALAALSDRVENGGGFGRRGSRVHGEVEAGPLRELGLSESLGGIAPGVDSEPG